MADQVDWHGTGGPRCPNHQVTLDRTDTPGIGICPISRCEFKYDTEAQSKKKKLKITAMGMVEEPDWQVKGEEQ